MGSKGRLPPFRRPLPGPDMLHSDHFGPGIHPPPGPPVPFDMVHPEVMEQRIAGLHMDMKRLALENQRLATSHSSLRQELAAAQQELARLQKQIDIVQADKVQQMKTLVDNIAKMENDLQSSESLKMELQRSHAEAQALVCVKHELMSKIQQLKLDLQRNHGDAEQMPALMSELEATRKEYEHWRSTYDYERKLRVGHHESLQVMEKNYISMVREVEKLRGELAKATNLEKNGVQYGNNAVYKENDGTVQQSALHNAYEDGYGASQGRSGGPTSYVGSGAPTRPGYDANKLSYDASRNPGFDASRNPAVDASRNTGYEGHHAANYEAPRGGANYEAPRGSGYDSYRGAGAPPSAMAAANIPTHNNYTAMQGPPQYGSTQNANPYGQQSAAYGSSQGTVNYGSAQAPNNNAAGSYEAVRGGGNMGRG